MAKSTRALIFSCRRVKICWHLLRAKGLPWFRYCCSSFTLTFFHLFLPLLVLLASRMDHFECVLPYYSGSLLCFALARSFQRMRTFHRNTLKFCPSKGAEPTQCAHFMRLNVLVSRAVAVTTKKNTCNEIVHLFRAHSTME